MNIISCFSSSARLYELKQVTIVARRSLYHIYGTEGTLFTVTFRNPLKVSHAPTSVAWLFSMTLLRGARAGTVLGSKHHVFQQLYQPRHVRGRNVPVPPVGLCLMTPG